MTGGETAVGYFIGSGFVLFLVLRVPQVPSLFPDHPLSLSRALLSLSPQIAHIAGKEWDGK